MEFETTPAYDLSKNIAEAIVNENVQIVVARIPVKQDLSPVFEGLNESDLMNALTLFSNYSLHQAEVLEKIRGESAKYIFLSPLLGTARKSYTPFVPEQNSTWILFLISPIDPSNQQYEKNVKAFGDIKYSGILSKLNYFEVFNSGYSAYCLTCAARAKQEGLQEVTTIGFIADIKRLVGYQSGIQKKHPREKLRADILSTLETEIGKKIFATIDQ